MLRRQPAVDRVGERATLDRADAEHAGATLLAGGDDIAGAARPREVFELTWRVDRIGNALYRGRPGRLAEGGQDAFGDADAGDAQAPMRPSATSRSQTGMKRST